jgi:hypothetical protein
VSKFIAVVALIALYLMLFLCIGIVHFRFLAVTVVLYAALLDAALAAVVTAVIAFGPLRPRLTATAAEIALSLCLGVLLAVLYSIMVPTLIDRSLSLYMLEKLHAHGAGITPESLARAITEDYFDERRVVDARLIEQLKSGTITIANGCVRLTPRGKLVVRLSQLYRKTLLPRPHEFLAATPGDLAAKSQHSVRGISRACE